MEDRWTHNTLPLAGTKAPLPRAGQWEVGCGYAKGSNHPPPAIPEPRKSPGLIRVRPEGGREVKFSGEAIG